MPSPLRKHLKHKGSESSSDSSEKNDYLLHFCGIQVLIELTLSGTAKLSMASCVYVKRQIYWHQMTPPTWLIN